MIALLRRGGLRRASSPSSGRSAGTPRSRSRRSRCRTSCAGPSASCGERPSDQTPARRAPLAVRPHAGGGPQGPARSGRAPPPRAVGRRDPRPHRARRQGRRHLRLGPLAERVPRGASRGARIDWPKVTAFHLDEYVGIGADHPASFRRFLVDRLFDHVPVAAFHGLDGQAPRPRGGVRALRRASRRARPAWRSWASGRTATWPSSTRPSATSRTRPTCGSSSSTRPAGASRSTTAPSRPSTRCRAPLSR